MNEQTRSVGFGPEEQLQRQLDQIEDMDPFSDGAIDTAQAIARQVRMVLKDQGHPNPDKIADDISIPLTRGNKDKAKQAVQKALDFVSEGQDVSDKVQAIKEGEDPEAVFMEQSFDDGLLSEQRVNGIKLIHSIPGALGDSINLYLQAISESARQADMDLTSVIMQTQAVGSGIGVTFEIHIRGIDVDLVDEMAEQTNTFFDGFDTEITTRSDDRLNFQVV
jgi:hypothetical protein